jgi:hypothetical protein
MIKKIIKKLDLEKNIKLISPIDEIKICNNIDKLNETIKSFEIEDPIEKYIQNQIIKKESHLMYLLNHNYFNNILISIYFIIGNPYSIDTKIFNIIYKNRNLINNVPKIIINNYDLILSDPKLYKFYNYDIILRWKNTVIPKKLNKKDYYKISKLSDSKKEKQWIKYNLIWNEYFESCLQLKIFITSLLKFYKPLNNKIVGCSHLGKKYYEYVLESYLGIKIDIDKLEKWANKELNKLIEQMKLYIKIIINKPVDNYTFKDLLNFISKDESQNFKSKKELVDLYKKTINKYENIYIKKLNFPQFEKPNLVIFDNPKLGGGYYYLNNFYLNVHNWTLMKKYTVESLVLHETIPGHHTQVHTMLNIENKYNLLFGYFGSSCTGFFEGWGLFSEKLGFEQTTWDKIGQLEFEIFRTLRIIVDIGLHYHGYSPEKMIEFMQDNLLMSKNEIINEVYRYCCLPGQAVSYKVGNEVFKQILEKQGINNLLEPNAIDLYKKLIINGQKPLKFICEDYNINFSYK